MLSVLPNHLPSELSSRIPSMLPSQSLLLSLFRTSMGDALGILARRAEGTVNGLSEVGDELGILAEVMAAASAKPARHPSGCPTISKEETISRKF